MILGLRLGGEFLVGLAATENRNQKASRSV
jgi:hypothetical protein